MKYECKTVPLSSLSDFRTKTLCDQCKNKDCENPIESQPVSIIGIQKQMKVYVTKTQTSVVLDCDGFIS